MIYLGYSYAEPVKETNYGNDLKKGSYGDFMSVMTLPALTISINEGDIKLGRRNVPSCCPIARALSRAGYKAINVWVTYLSFLDPETDTFHFVNLTSEVQQFVKNFDRDRTTAKPITFVLSYE